MTAARKTLPADPWARAQVEAMDRLRDDRDALMRALEHALEMDGQDPSCPECADARRLLKKLRGKK